MSRNDRCVDNALPNEGVVVVKPYVIQKDDFTSNELSDKIRSFDVVFQILMYVINVTDVQCDESREIYVFDEEIWNIPSGVVNEGCQVSRK